jgi:hypothetical protein
MKRIILSAVVVAAAVLGYRYFFPGDEAKIRGVLERIAAAVSAGAEEEGEMSRLARAASVRNELDPEISVDAGPPFRRMQGRDAIIGTIARLRGSVRDLVVSFEDVDVTIDPDGTSAQVYLTAEARYRDGSGARGLEARELEVAMRKLEGDWVVSKVTLVRTLEPLSPQ